MSEIKEVQLHYHIENNGDGSASAKFHPTREEAERAEEMDEGWGEPCVGSLKLGIVNGEICYKKMQWNDNTRSFDYFWIPLV